MQEIINVKLKQIIAHLLHRNMQTNSSETIIQVTVKNLYAINKHATMLVSSMKGRRPMIVKQDIRKRDCLLWALLTC